MNQTEINQLMHQILNNYCAGNWEKIVGFYGEDMAKELDFLEPFDYMEVYEKGDVKECLIFYHIAVIQRFLVASMYDIGENDEAMKTYCTLQYMSNKLFDKGTGVNDHTWLN